MLNIFRCKIDLDKMRETFDLFTSQVCHFDSLCQSSAARSHSKVVQQDDGTFKRQLVPKRDGFFTRKMEKVELRVETPPFSVEHEPVFDLFDFYSIEFQDRSFFHHQVLTQR